VFCDPSCRRPLFRPLPGEFRTFLTTKLVGIWLWIDFRHFQPNIMCFHPHLHHFEIILLVISFSLYVYNCLYFFICNYNFYLRLFFFSFFGRSFIYGFIESQTIQPSENSHDHIKLYLQTWMVESNREIYFAPYIDA